MTKRQESGLLEVAGFSLFHNDLETWEIFTLLLQGAGGTLFNADLTAPAFAGPEGLKALNFMFELINTDQVTDLGFGLGPGGSASPLNQSRAAMIIAGNYSTNNAIKAGLDFDVLPIPMENGGFTSLVDPFSFAVTKASPNTASAYTFIEFALSQEQQVAFALASKNVPVLKSAQQDATVQADPFLAKFIKTASFAPPTAAAIPGLLAHGDDHRPGGAGNTCSSGSRRKRPSRPPKPKSSTSSVAAKERTMALQSSTVAAPIGRKTSRRIGAPTPSSLLR